MEDKLREIAAREMEEQQKAADAIGQSMVMDNLDRECTEERDVEIVSVMDIDKAKSIADQQKLEYQDNLQVVEKSMTDE